MTVHAREHHRPRIPGKIDLKAEGYVVPWDPTDIAGCQLWLDANQILGLNDGDPVALWEDESGNNKDATSAGGLRPTYKINILNGKPVVRFIPTDDMVVTGLNCGNVASLIFVLIPVPNNPRGFLDTAPAGANTVRNYNRAQFEWHPNNPLLGLGLAAATAVLVEFLLTNAPNRNIKYYKNAGLVSNNNGAGGVGVAWNNPRIGSINFGGAGWYDGDIAEVVFYNNLLSDADRGDLEAYLNAKYAIY